MLVVIVVIHSQEITRVSLCLECLAVYSCFLVLLLHVLHKNIIITQDLLLCANLIAMQDNCDLGLPTYELAFSIIRCRSVHRWETFNLGPSQLINSHKVHKFRLLQVILRRQNKEILQKWTEFQDCLVFPCNVQNN